MYYCFRYKGKRSESPGRKAADPNLKSRRVAGLHHGNYIRSAILTSL